METIEHNKYLASLRKEVEEIKEKMLLDNNLLNKLDTLILLENFFNKDEIYRLKIGLLRNINFNKDLARGLKKLIKLGKANGP